MSRYLRVLCMSFLGVALTIQIEGAAMSSSKQEVKVVPGVGITWLEGDARYVTRHISGQEWTEQTLLLWKQRVENYLAGRHIDSDIVYHLRRFEVSLGMSAEQVHTIWGEALKKELLADKTMQRWIYSFGNTKARIELILHNNRVTRIREFSSDVP